MDWMFFDYLLPALLHSAIPAQGHNIQISMIPDRVISLIELKRYTGERGTRMWIAHHGIVYDVTDCPKWRTGMHEFLHFAGQDLTSELPDAPHEDEVFKHGCVKIIGRLEDQN